jgi:hypothetical protein
LAAVKATKYLGQRLIDEKEARSMMTSTLGLASKAIERVLELSVDAHILRRQFEKDSPEFHTLTGTIKAYGKVLALLTALQDREEFYEVVGQYESSEHAEVVN